MKAWLSLVSFGLFASLVVTSCVITSEDSDDDENGGEAGEFATGGRTTGGRGGTGGTTGGRATGGTPTGGTSTGGTSTGGTTGGTQATGGMGDGGEAPSSCLVGSTPAETCEFDGAGECEQCLAAECCEEVKGCYGSDPDDVCGWPANAGEFACAQLCLAAVYAEGDYPTDTDVIDCLEECDTCMTSTNMLPNAATGPLVACMNDSDCGEVCYQQIIDEG